VEDFEVAPVTLVTLVALVTPVTPVALVVLVGSSNFFSAEVQNHSKSKKDSSSNHAPSAQCSQRKAGNLCPPRVLGSP